MTRVSSTANSIIMHDLNLKQLKIESATNVDKFQFQKIAIIENLNWRVYNEKRVGEPLKVHRRKK